MIKIFKKKRKIKSSSGWTVIRILILIFILFVFVNFGKGLYKIIKLEKIKKTEEQSINTSLKEKQALQLEFKRLTGDSLYIEEIARRDYGMIKKGEEVFHITLPDTTKNKKKR